MLIDSVNEAAAECAKIACGEGMIPFLDYAFHPTGTSFHRFFIHAQKCPSCTLAMEDFQVEVAILAADASPFSH